MIRSIRRRVGFALSLSVTASAAMLAQTTVTIRAGRHLRGALRRGHWIAHCPAAENGPVKTLSIPAWGKIFQKTERGASRPLWG